MKLKINIQLALISLLAIVTTTVGITLVYYSLFQRQVRDDLKQNAWLLKESELFQNAYEQKGEGKSPAHLDPGNLRITWIDEDGTVLFDNDTNASGLSNHLDRPEIHQAFAVGEGESTRRSDTMNMDTFNYALLLENGTVLRVSTQARTIVNVLFNALPVIGLVVMLILLGCVFLGHLLTGQLMRPLEQMAENMDEVEMPVYKELEPFARKIRSQHENILAAAKSRQDFTANVSHELKTPITAISGYAELIENHMVEKAEEARVAGQIRQNADRLLSIVNDILQLSELDQFEPAGTFETMDLYAAAKESVNDLKHTAARKQIRLECRGSSAGIRGDKRLIREMIDNLVQNGIRYNRENGSVEVEVSILNGHPILVVKDTGIGIPADQLDRVFERFYRVDKSRSRETGGTGLGLAIVKHIVELHSAQITIQSALGEGTELRVRF